MRRLQDLSYSEMDSFSSDLAEIQSDATEKVIKVADKYGVSRDEVMKDMLTVMHIVTELKQLEDYEINEEEANENRS